MTTLVVCATLFFILFAIVLGISFFHASSRMFSVILVRGIAWFVLSSLLGFTLVNEILKIENPIELTVALMIIAATVISIIRKLILPETAILRDIIPAFAGVLLFALTRFVMHAIGMDIVDQFEVFLD